MNGIDLGKAHLSPQRPVVAGSCQRLRLTYIVGHPIDDSGYIKVAFRYAGDFGTPQFTFPDKENYCFVETNGACRLQLRWDPKGHVRPWGQCLLLKVAGGFLTKGDKVRVYFGGIDDQSPGWRMQTFCQKSFEFKVLVDPFATYQFKELSNSPSVKIIPGPPERIKIIAPSDAVPGKEVTYHAKLEDRWGNPVGKPTKLYRSPYDSKGIKRISYQDRKTGLKGCSNPIRVADPTPEVRYYWGDIHGQSEETIGTNSVEDYFSFARDYGLLDITGHQGNDFQISDDFWNKLNRITKRFNRSGSFTTLPGYEWSGNTPLGGDRNVFYEREGGKIFRSSRELIPDKIEDNDLAPTVEDLFSKLRNCPAPRSFVLAHVGGRYADIRRHNSELEIGVEAHSAWGTFEWLLHEAMKRHYIVGFYANSDGHKGRPGASYPGAGKFGSYGGLTCFLAPTLDRSSICKSIWARRTYATTGNRPLIELKLTLPNGKVYGMGDIIREPFREAMLEVNIAGTAPIEKVDVRDGLEMIKTMRPYAENDLGRRIKFLWSGAEVKGRNRMVSWAGKLKVFANSICHAEPINFWNPDKPLNIKDGRTVSWESTTTGGCAGMILSFEKGKVGSFNLETDQGQVAKIPISSIGLKPLVKEYGGLDKKIEIYRLPDARTRLDYSFKVPVRKLSKRFHALYVFVQQEDGHMAWTSPIYAGNACMK